MLTGADKLTVLLHCGAYRVNKPLHLMLTGADKLTILLHCGAYRSEQSGENILLKGLSTHLGYMYTLYSLATDSLYDQSKSTVYIDSLIRCTRGILMRKVGIAMALVGSGSEYKGLRIQILILLFI
jgi:hypothetical protein